MSKPKIFVSYSRKDKKYLEDLEAQMAGLRRNDLIDSWTDQEIMPGEVWEETLKQQLEIADIIIFLVSPDFIASDYIYDVEVKKAIERHNKGKVIIIPIVIRPCDFASLPLSKFQALPRNAIPISKWEDKDEAWLDTLKGLKIVISNWDDGKVGKRHAVQKGKFKRNKRESLLADKQNNFNEFDTSNIKMNLAEGKIETAISDLLKVTREKDNDLYNSIIMQSSKFNRLKKDSENGLISNEHQNISQSQITNSLLSIVDELKVH